MGNQKLSAILALKDTTLNQINVMLSPKMEKLDSSNSAKNLYINLEDCNAILVKMENISTSTRTLQHVRMDLSLIAKFTKEELLAENVRKEKLNLLIVKLVILPPLVIKKLIIVSNILPLMVQPGNAKNVQVNFTEIINQVPVKQSILT